MNKVQAARELYDAELNLQIKFESLQKTELIPPDNEFIEFGNALVNRNEKLCQFVLVVEV